MFSKEQVAKMLDSTLLKATATREDIAKLCDEAARYHFASVCVFPFWLPLVRRKLQKTDVKPCTVIGFPYGANVRAVKAYEIKAAVSHGARELDIVINVGAVKSGEWEIVETEIKDMVETTRLTGMTQETRGLITKFIIECCYLTDDEKKRVSEIIVEAGGDFVKTSTGTATGGATPEDIRLIRSVVGPEIGVKAAGGIRTTEQAMDMINAGANRIGASCAAAIIDAYDES